MKLLVLISSLVMLTQAQRPSYASSGPIGRPGLANRFKEDNDGSSSTVSVENRVGVDGSTPKIPVDARGDVDLVNTLNTWEREHQPFWLLNSDHIEKARNTTRGGQISNNQGSPTNVQGNQGGSTAQGNLNNRIGNTDNSNNSGNRRNPPVNRDWMYGRPSQGDIRPVYEAPETLLNEQRINQGRRPSEGTQKRPRFHYEMNHFN